MTACSWMGGDEISCVKVVGGTGGIVAGAGSNRGDEGIRWSCWRESMSSRVAGSAVVGGATTLMVCCRATRWLLTVVAGRWYH